MAFQMHTHFPSLDICALCRILEERPKTAEENDKKCAGLELDTDTVIIGNGPAGIALSALLSGWQPFYNAQNPHPNHRLHEWLIEAGEESLLSQDLCSLAKLSLFDQSPNLSPFAALYDSLVRPHHNSSACSASQSCLEWRRSTGGNEKVAHIVLGDQHIGGSWTEYDDEMVTVSISNWMDLPGYSLAKDFLSDPSFAQCRVRAALYKHYLLAYVLSMGLEHNFRPFTKVTQLEKLCHAPSGIQYWEIRGIHDGAEHQEFVFRCRNVVLACGQRRPRLLGVSGELASTRLVYDLTSLRDRLENIGGREGHPVVVVGDGISAADAVLHCLQQGVPVLHVMRRQERQLRSIMLSRLSASVYPEYARIFQLMIGRVSDQNYSRICGTTVGAVVDEGDKVLLKTSDGGQHTQNFRWMAICIGRRSEFPLLPKGGPAHEFGTNYQSSADPTLFAIGAMAGDHFVRYLVGGALCVAKTLLAEQQVNYEQRAKAQMSKCRIEGRRGNVSGIGMFRTASATPLAMAMARAFVGSAGKAGGSISRAKSHMQLSAVV